MIQNIEGGISPDVLSGRVETSKQLRYCSGQHIIALTARIDLRMLGRINTKKGFPMSNTPVSILPDFGHMVSSFASIVTISAAPSRRDTTLSIFPSSCDSYRARFVP